MPAHLLSLADGPSILIDKPILLFGRHEECDVQLNSKKVSRRHCVLAQVGDYLVIRDLGSTNGVRINGERVAEGKLKPGDELQIGNFKYQVCGDLLGRSNEHPVPDEYKAVPPVEGAGEAALGGTAEGEAVDVPDKPKEDEKDEKDEKEV